MIKLHIILPIKLMKTIIKKNSCKSNIKHITTILSNKSFNLHKITDRLNLKKVFSKYPIKYTCETSLTFILKVKVISVENLLTVDRFLNSLNVRYTHIQDHTP